MKCKICNKELKQITNSHLKSHNITTTEYKQQFGELVDADYIAKCQSRSGTNNPNYNKKWSQEQKDQLSNKLKGKPAHNKGQPLSDQQKNKISNKLKGKPAHNKGKSHSIETKELIKQARQHQIITTESALKAINTKQKNGYDLAFFKGHTHTNKSKELISINSREHNQIKSIQAFNDARKRATEYGYTLLDRDHDIAKLECNNCNTQFYRTIQYLSVSKIKIDMCPYCFPKLYGSSTAEKEIASFLNQYTYIISNAKHLIPPKEIDIYLPEYQLAIEYNGLYWHSEIYVDRYYHVNKTIELNKLNIRLIHIFEDEWINNPDIVKSRLLNAIGHNTYKIPARKCQIKQINSTQANQFIKENHIQNIGRANVHLGLIYNDELVSVMTFLKGDISKNIKEWELNRFANKLNTIVIGGASRLFNYFVKNYSPATIISFADIRWSTFSPVYEKLGFQLVHATEPNYWYIMPNEIKRIHRFKLRKPENCDITEQELRESQGYIRIYDCGSLKYIWERTAQ